jgi:hypothetical protein
MLLDRVSATQSFSDLDASEESFSPVASGTDRHRPRAVDSRRVVASDARNDFMVPGDRVVFARLDVAEALGIWRHATGRVVETHDETPAAPDGRVTVDVQFEGHEILQHYLPDLFEKRAN